MSWFNIRLFGSWTLGLRIRVFKEVAIFGRFYVIGAE
jgi:hypothetical protein